MGGRPVLVDVDIGHRPPQLLLVNGALARVQWQALAGGTLRPGARTAREPCSCSQSVAGECGPGLSLEGDA